MKKYGLSINLLIYTLIIFSVLFTGCQKKKERLLIGQWKLVPETKPDTSNYIRWTFFDGDRLEIVPVINSDTSDVKIRTYHLQSETLKYFINVTGDEGEFTEDGKYRIDELTKKVLHLQRVEFTDGTATAAYLRREFVKE